jgi:hypothetical protein
MAQAGTEDDRERLNVWGHLDVRNQERLAVVLSKQIPELFRLNRVIEQRTGYSSEIGKNMLVDVLSHLGTLAERTDLSAEQEASQLSKIEEHLRRAMIEHPEEVVRARIVDVRSLWSTYHRDAFPYRLEDALHGVPRHMELEELRTRIDVLLEAARRQKPNETTWEESLDAAAEMTEAAHLTGELADKLEQCIGVAQRITDERSREKRSSRKWWVALAVTVVLGAAGIATSYVLANDSPSPSPSTVKSTQTSP